MAFTITPPATGKLFGAGQVVGGGRYLVHAEISRGGSAVVYKALDRHTSQLCALKAMTLASVGDSPHEQEITRLTKARIHGEIKNSSRLNHNNLVTLQNVFAEGRTLVLVWELVRGQDLLGVINDSPRARIPEPRAKHYFRQLLAAVQFLHDHEICHRDIKPENLMVDSVTDTLKVIDFGLSKNFGSARTLGVGTPDYMPPELMMAPLSGAAAGAGGGAGPGGGDEGAAQPGPSYDAALADVWSMGATLYLMTIGSYPFEGPNPRDVASMLRNAVAGRYKPLPPELAASDLGDLIARMLQPLPANRISLEGVRTHPWLAEPPAPAPTLTTQLSASALLATMALGAGPDDSGPGPEHTAAAGNAMAAKGKAAPGPAGNAGAPAREAMCEADASALDTGAATGGGFGCFGFGGRGSRAPASI